MKIRVILNPYANRWKARSQADAVRAALRAAELDYTLIETETPGDAVHAATSLATEDCDAVVAAGGDGTVNEVVNGLLASAGDGPTRPLGILPLGTANDFAEMAGIPRDLSHAAAVIAAGHAQRVDAGRVTYCQGGRASRRAAAQQELRPPAELQRDSENTPGRELEGAEEGPAPQPHVRYFANNCAVAMEPLVTVESTRIRWLSGNARYVVALLRALRGLQAWQMRITWDDGRYEGPVYLLSVCNGRRCGGVFRMAPNARLDDGLFDFVYAPELSKLDVLRVLPRLFRGTHVHHPRITCRRARRITIESNPGTPIHADGEVLTESATHIDYELLPAQLTLLTPPP